MPALARGKVGKLLPFDGEGFPLEGVSGFGLSVWNMAAGTACPVDVGG